MQTGEIHLIFKNFNDKEYAIIQSISLSTINVKSMKRNWIILLITGLLFSPLSNNKGYCSSNQKTHYSQNNSKVTDEIKASIHIKSQSYSKALKEIAKTFNVGLTIDAKLVPTGMVSLDLENVTIEQALDGLLKNTDVKAILSPDGNNIILRKKDSAKTQNFYHIKGKVIGQDQEPLPGVTVSIEGSTSGTITDVNGDFSLDNIPEGETVLITFIGMKPQKYVITENIDSKTIELEEENVALNEVVVIGYGAIKRKDLTSSITTINADDLNSGVYSDPVQMLQGKAAGLNITYDGDPTGSPSIVLRGASTLREGDAQEPLYVIDGIPGGSLDLVSSAEIVSIDILKDASATAIYGSQAANGVIIITTKRGGQGQVQVGYDASLAVETISNKIEMMSADELRNYLETNGYSLDSDDDDGSNTDWQGEVSQIGVSQRHNLTITGGNNNTNYHAGVNYLSKEGIIKTSKLSRMTVRNSINQSVLDDRLNLGIAASGSITDKSKIPGSVLLNSVRYLPTIGVYDDDGAYNENAERGYNPVALLNENSDDERIKTFQGAFNAKLNVFRDLDWEARVSYQNSQDNENIYYGKNSLLGSGYNGYAKCTSFASEQKIIETYGTYAHTFKDHKVSLLAGYSWQENTTGDGFQATNSDFISDETTYNNLSLGSSYNIDYGDSTKATLRRIAFYSRLMYSYKEKYMLQATIRHDGSSAFGENNRWGNFPSVSAAWRINKESFMKDIDLFNDLRLRAGYGVSGNSLGFDAYASKLTYESSNMYYSNGEYVTAIFPSKVANPDLKWERTAVLNLGLDFSILKGRFGGTIEYYNKLTKDLIWDYTVSYTEYYTDTYTANVGKLENKGFEVTLNATPVKNQKIQWNTSVTASFNKNKILSLSNDEFQLDYVYTSANKNAGQSNTYNQIIQENYPVGQFYLWKWAGRNDEGVSQFYTKDGGVTTSPSSDDRFYVGNAQPKAIFSWNNTITYKKLSLNMFFRGVSGNMILNNTRAGLNYPAECTHYNMLKTTMDEPIEDTKAHYTSDRYLEKGDYIRLDNLSLSYNLNNFQLYVTMNNVFVITGYKGLDPEVELGGLTPGVDANDYYPKTRTLLLGVKLNLK